MLAKKKIGMNTIMAMNSTAFWTAKALILNVRTSMSGSGIRGSR